MLLDPLRSGALEETIPSATEVTVRISAKQDPLVFLVFFFFFPCPREGLLPGIGQGSTPPPQDWYHEDLLRIRSEGLRSMDDPVSGKIPSS